MGIKNIKDSLKMKSKSYLSIEKNVTKSEKTIHFKYCVQHKTCLKKFYKKIFSLGRKSVLSNGCETFKNV